MSLRMSEPLYLLTAEGNYICTDCCVGRRFRVAKLHCQAGELAEARYGALFAVASDGRLSPASRQSMDPCHILTKIPDGDASSANKDNRYLNDDNSAQRLNVASIRAMKFRGECGSAIIGSLAVGSSTWGHKTEHSRSKWLRRKAKKYIPWVQILRPTSVVIAEAHFESKHVNQACRPDVIGQLLALSNARAGSRVSVMDHFHGVVAGAIAERIGPTGRVEALSYGPKCSIDGFNGKQHIPSMPYRNSMHALVIASNYEPMSILQTTFVSLLPGCPLVIYSSHIEPLARAFAWLKDSDHFVHLRLTEPWQREFQVLSGRTHPAMSMSVKAGYILSALKVLA